LAMAAIGMVRRGSWFKRRLEDLLTRQ
jgi:hypothetical protein